LKRNYPILELRILPIIFITKIKEVSNNTNQPQILKTFLNLRVKQILQKNLGRQ